MMVMSTKVVVSVWFGVMAFFSQMVFYWLVKDCVFIDGFML